MTTPIRRPGGARLLLVLLSALLGLGGTVAAGRPAQAAGAPAFVVVSTSVYWSNNNVYVQPSGGYLQFSVGINGTGLTGTETVTMTSDADSSRTITTPFGTADPLNHCSSSKGSNGTGCMVNIAFPADSTPGTWTMTSVDLQEPDGSTYHQPVTPDLGYRNTIPTAQVQAGANPIQVSDFALSATSVDNRGQNRTVTLSMTASDSAGTITQAMPEFTGDCWSEGPITWSGTRLSVPVTVPAYATSTCTINSFRVSDNGERVAFYPGSTKLSITVTEPATSTITIGPVSFPHALPATGTNAPVSFTVTDTAPLARITVTAHGPVSGHDCAPSAVVQYPLGTFTASVSVSLPFAAAGSTDTPGGPQPTGCAPGLYALQIDVNDYHGTHSYGATGTSLGAPLDISVGSAGTYVPLPPQRALDTRQGSAVAASGALRLRVAGAGQVPANAVAVVMNVTVTDATAGGYVTVYPSGEAAPVTSNLNHTAGRTIANLVTVQVGAGGSVTFLNGSGGSVDLVADVTGYYVPDTTGAVYTGIDPLRALDTRTGTPGTLAARGTTTLNLCARGGLPAKATAAALNVTVTGPGTSGFVSVYPHGQAWPGTSNLNFTASETIPNMVDASLGNGCSVDIFNGSNAPVALIVDTMGYFTPDTTGQTTDGVLVTGRPERLIDTRTDRTPPKPVSGYTSISGWGLRPGDWGIGSLLLNVTATGATADSYVTVFPDAAPANSPPDGTGLPMSSNLNFTRGETIPNMVNATVGADGYVDFYNHAGDVHLVVDLFGYYTRSSTGVPPNAAPARAASTSPTASGVPGTALAAHRLMTTTVPS
ncbi:hypothetical protein GCM10009760_63060 [Kitasatospora kazusensis]|uniref:Ig-like domain-containing protein n=1 Tax=Kitasatospora kazusensis TaxID=407974 RepID=A0ABN1ZLR9_9ACTN